jgi:hypothetical protein
MKPFLTSKRKLLELGVLPLLCLVLYLALGEAEVIALFVIGFVWNWVASHDLDLMLGNRRYRYSLVQLVKSAQEWPRQKLGEVPAAVVFILKLLPAGTFWFLVILFNDSVMPWWATFLGSLCFELTQVDLIVWRKREELP